MPEFHRPQYQFVDYALLEEASTVRHEFHDVVMWALAGGSPEHARIAGNVITLLNTQLAGKRCTAFSSDLRIRVKSAGLATYPECHFWKHASKQKFFRQASSALV